MDGIFDQSRGEMWLVVSPELPQSSSICPFRYEERFRAPADCGYVIDDIQVAELVDLSICSGFSLPCLSYFTHYGPVIAVRIMILPDSYPTISLRCVSL